MLTREENELLTQVGRGTPCGELLRRYWHPVAAAAELTERVCCGLEIEAPYVDVIVCRWQQLTGRPATLHGDGRSFDQIKAERLG